MSSERDSAEVAYGGQAVIEGVMIRSPRFVSVACRLPGPDGRPSDHTAIDVCTEPVRSVLIRRPWLRKVPLLRGFAALFEMLGIGLRALERSGNLQLPTALLAPVLLATAADDDAKSSAGDGAGALNGPVMWTTIAVSLLIGGALFVWLPNHLADWLGHRLGWAHSRLGLNLIESAVRLVFFVAYIGLIGLMPDIRRVFMYHGAEHKVVNAYEAGRELTPAAVADMSVIHPRCGTNFAFIVILLSFVIFAFLPWTHSGLARLAMRLACLPLVSGLGFELVKLVGAHRDVAWLQALIWPGLVMQRLTTRPPAPDMLEVALASFTAVRQAEEGGDLLCTRLTPEAAA
jgi:uncharacterized protein YqhQ